jgi:hypothetical protein
MTIIDRLSLHSKNVLKKKRQTYLKTTLPFVHSVQRFWAYCSPSEALLLALRLFYHIQIKPRDRHALFVRKKIMFVQLLESKLTTVNGRLCPQNARSLIREQLACGKPLWCKSVKEIIVQLVHKTIINPNPN